MIYIDKGISSSGIDLKKILGGTGMLILVLDLVPILVLVPDFGVADPDP